VQEVKCLDVNYLSLAPCTSYFEVS